MVLGLGSCWVSIKGYCIYIQQMRQGNGRRVGQSSWETLGGNRHREHGEWWCHFGHLCTKCPVYIGSNQTASSTSRTTTRSTKRANYISGLLFLSLVRVKCWRRECAALWWKWHLGTWLGTREWHSSIEKGFGSVGCNGTASTPVPPHARTSQFINETPKIYILYVKAVYVLFLLPMAGFWSSFLTAILSAGQEMWVVEQSEQSIGWLITSGEDIK